MEDLSMNDLHIRIEGEQAQLMLDIIEGRRPGIININTDKRVIEIITTDPINSPTLAVSFVNPADPAAPPITGQGTIKDGTLMVGVDPAQPGSDQTVIRAFNMPPQPQPAQEFLTRFFENEPEDARLRFRPEDKVKLMRPDLLGLVPVGAVGKVIRLNHPAHVMSLKGRHYVVWFELTNYKIPVPADWRQARAMPNAPEFLERLEIDCKVQDLELIEKGSNWREDYEFPYHLDGVANAAMVMTPADWRINIEAVTSGILNSTKNRTPGVSSVWPQTVTFSPEQWVKLLINNPAPGDLTVFDIPTLEKIQDYLEQKRVWTLNEARLHFNIIEEWDRREKLEPPDDLPPADTSYNPFDDPVSNEEAPE